MSLNIKSIKKIPNNEAIVVGCSAGPDSMALLHYLNNNMNNQVICCHINHNVRKESMQEEEYLKNYCQKESIIFESIKIKNYKENNFENEARKKRYAFYEKTLKKYHSKYLFLAHHGDDLIETILMKIERGSNLEGYAGIKEISKKNNYYIIRPFLKYTKKELIKYNKENKITYFIDKSNSNQNYTRNRYRKNILPFLKKQDRNIHKKYLNYSKILLEYHNYITDEITVFYKEIINNNKINLIEFKKLHPFIQKNILYIFLNTYYQNKDNIIKNKHIEAIINQINNKKPNITIDLPNNTISIKEYNTLEITQKKIREKTNYKIPLQDYNKIGNIIIKKIENTNRDGNDICRLNSKNIKLPLYLRNKNNGDYIELKGMNGKKKVSDIFIEKKIPITLREDYPLLVDNDDNIIWIPNLKKSKFNSQKNDFCDIILKNCEKEEKNEQ